MKINLDNYFTADNAVRDILFFYTQMIKFEGEFNYDQDTGKFDPFIFVDAEMDKNIELDLDLLQQGSAAVILHELYTCLDFFEEMHEYEFIKKLIKNLDDSKFSHLPDFENAIKLGLRDDDKFFRLLQKIYKKYIIGYFKKLIK